MRNITPKHGEVDHTDMVIMKQRGEIFGRIGTDPEFGHLSPGLWFGGRPEGSGKS